MISSDDQAEFERFKSMASEAQMKDFRKVKEFFFKVADTCNASTFIGVVHATLQTLRTLSPEEQSDFHATVDRFDDLMRKFNEGQKT